MPRICPLQLLTCLTVLMSPEGGILSRDEVPRLVNLMTKFSKKLVSKCVYVLILKNTEESLVDLFMAEGGWNLIHTWLQDAINVSNWDLVKEILSLLIITPVDVERLKTNNIPKLVKSLSRLDEVKGVQELSTQLVHDWLAIVKGNTPNDQIAKTEVVQAEQAEVVEVTNTVSIDQVNNDTVDSAQINEPNDTELEAISTNNFYKLTLRDGKQVISRTASLESSSDDATSVEISKEPQDSVDVKKESKSDDKNKSSDKSKSKSRSSSSKHSSSSSRSKSGNSSSSSSSSSKDRHRSSSKSSSRDKDRDRDKDKKDRHKSNGVKSSSHTDKSDQKEKQAEKDKDTLAKIKPQSIDKIGRIPKKTDDKTKEIKKPTMSIEVRKNTEERPKTVKVFNSKRRSTGLEEEAKPPPPRPTKKPSVALPPPPIPTKRTSPIKDLPTPPEKKFKIDIPDRPGAIKLIPPKPKPPVLQESDIFMDALAASASAKKEPKKRKRRPSVSKETPGSPTSQEQQTPTSPVTSPMGLKNIAAPNFYQDTLQAEEKNDEPAKEETPEENAERSVTPIEAEVERPHVEGALKGALVYTKKKGPKKSVKFNDSNLTQVRFFELDETERVNVTRNFMDMAKMEMTSEREALQLSRKTPNEDVMEPQTMWRLPFVTDLTDPLAPPGAKSLEKDIQFAREKTVLQALYFDKRKIPDSPEEPVPETHQMSDPITIPLEDSESQEMDLRNTPWPEPKGSPPPMQENVPPQIFTSMPMPFQNFPQAGPPAFQGMPPRFAPPGGPGVFGGPPNMLPNGNMMGPPNMGPPPEMMHQGPLNPAAFGPGPDNFNNPMMNDNNFQMPFNHNMGMFPPNNFNMNRGGGRGGFRRGGNNSGPWIRMNGPGGPWNNRGGGGRGRLCKNVKNHGFCRNMDKCPFIHPK